MESSALDRSSMNTFTSISSKQWSCNFCLTVWVKLIAYWAAQCDSSSFPLTPFLRYFLFGARLPITTVTLSVLLLLHGDVCLEAEAAVSTVALSFLFGARSPVTTVTLSALLLLHRDVHLEAESGDVHLEATVLDIWLYFGALDFLHLKMCHPVVHIKIWEAFT